MLKLRSLITQLVALFRSIFEYKTRFFFPLENLILETMEWNRHVARNQIVDLKAARNLVVSWRKASCEWTTIESDAADHFEQEVHDCALSLVRVLRQRSPSRSSKSLCAPFMLYFTSAFVGDFQLRLSLLDEIVRVWQALDPDAVEVRLQY